MIAKLACLEMISTVSFENPQIFNVESYECINYLLEGMGFNDVLDRGGAQGHRRSHLGPDHSMTSKKKAKS